MARILVVEDEPAVRKLVANMLEFYGHCVCEAEHGQAALDIMDEEDVDLVLSDLRMPVMDGGVLLSVLRARGDHMPFVLMSGHHPALDQCPVVTADDFVAKPFSLKVLRSVIERALTGQAVA